MQGKELGAILIAGVSIRKAVKDEVKEGEEVEEVEETAHRIAMATLLLDAERRGATLRLPALREGASPNFNSCRINPELT
jgi:hypothetical protein